MERFALTYADYEICPQPVGELSWRANRMLLDKLNTNEERLWYANKAIGKRLRNEKERLN